MSQKKYNNLKLLSLGFIKSPFKFQLISRVFSVSAEKFRTLDVNEFNPMCVDSDDL
jgi:hypothetical protein